MGDNCKEMECAVIELNDLTAIFKLFFSGSRKLLFSSSKSKTISSEWPNWEQAMCLEMAIEATGPPSLFFFLPTIGFDANKAID